MFHHSFTGQLLMLQFTILLFYCSHHNTTLSLNVRVSLQCVELPYGLNFNVENHQEDIHIM